MIECSSPVLTPSARLASVEFGIRRLMPADVSVELSLGDGDARVLIDPEVFDEITAILVINARRAMPDGGSLHLRTTVLREERRFCLDVTDSGAGLQADDI